jgi:Tol biopolymer transport system component
MVIVLVGLLASPAAQSLDVELQRAIQRETISGDLAAAIAEYHRIARQAGVSREVAARAMFREARSYERLGRPEAREVYEAIVREFPDRPAVVADARTRLAAGAAPRQVEVTPRRVLDGGWAQMFDVSADGRVTVGPQRVSYSGFDIVARDAATGASSTVVSATPHGSSFQPRISDDGRHVAYSWWEDLDGDTKYSLRIVALGSVTPQIVPAPPKTAVVPSDWAPDGKSVLVVLTEYGDAARPQQVTSRQLAWVSVETGTLRTIKTFEHAWQQPFFDARVSPDGRFIAYTARARADAADRYVYVMNAADGSQDHAVVTAAGTRESPAWTPDGSRLIFQGTSGNGTALWAVSLRDGQPVGEPWVVQSDFQHTALGFTASGSFYYVRGSRPGNLEYIVSRPGVPGDRPAMFAGLNASWSPTGSIAIWRNNALVIRQEASGEEQSFRPADIDIIPPRWLADGSVIVVVDEGEAGQSRQAFHVVNTQTGTSRRLFGRDANGRLRTNVSAVSPDGRTLYLGVRSNAASAVSGIVAIDVATGEERPVLTFPQVPPPSSGFGLAISPDGTTLAVQTWVKPNAAARIFTVGVDGSRYREVVTAFETGWTNDTVRWTPDGQTLLFVAFDANRNWRIMRVAAEGSEPEFDGLSFDTLSKQLPDLRLFPGNFNNIDLSPDGSRIMVSTLTMGRYELWTLDNLLWAINAR